MNNDTTILLLIAEQHSVILGLRQENSALQQRLQELESQKSEQTAEEQNDKSSSGSASTEN